MTAISKILMKREFCKVQGSTPWGDKLSGLVAILCILCKEEAHMLGEGVHLLTLTAKERMFREFVPTPNAVPSAMLEDGLLLRS